MARRAVNSPSLDLARDTCLVEAVRASVRARDTRRIEAVQAAPPPYPLRRSIWFASLRKACSISLRSAKYRSGFCQSGRSLPTALASWRMDEAGEVNPPLPHPHPSPDHRSHYQARRPQGPRLYT